ncbi:uncharacterized protein LOC133922269 [Phragmites australis]|uniref:uncharacterized protein LOC133922269 n=1 Tax=Phragmites australis TaxID=29695 RepID=UPI002D77B74F|nr:uncharacterized protein LOC133922269 [Phragmites australis]
MARKRRAPSPAPPPPPPPPQEESSSEESGSSSEEEPPRAAAPQNPSQNPRPAPSAADSSEEDSETDAHAFQLRQVARSPSKAPAPAPQPESDDEEEGESSESEPEIPKPVQKKAAAQKSKAEQDRKRSAPEPAPSGKAKKAKAAAPEATPPSKLKKSKAESEKTAVAPEPIPSGKAKKPGSKLEHPALDPSPSIKSEKLARTLRTWTKDDEMKILEVLATHVKSEGVLPKTEYLLGALRDRLNRKNCSYTDMYEKVRRLRERYEKAVSTGTLPSEEDELQMYNLSESVWGEKAKEAIAAATSQNDGILKKSKKGQANKEKMDGNSKDATSKETVTSIANRDGNTQKGSKKGQAIKEKTDGNVKSRVSKEATTTATPRKSKKHGNHKEEWDEDAKRTLKEATTATQNGGALTKSKRGKTDKEKMDRGTQSLVPKAATSATHNCGTPTKSKEEETERDANVQGMHRGFDDLQKLYSNLAAYVEIIEVQHPCGETLKRAFEFIGDEKAHALDSKIKKQRIAEAKVQIHRADIKKQVLNTLISLVD